MPPAGIPFALVTVVYLALSLFGSALYLVLPPALCSLGARSHAYLLIHAALNENPTTGQILLMVCSQLFVFALVAMGVLAIIKGPGKVYGLMVTLDILVTLLFLLLTGDQYSHTSGILFNIVYCLWLLRILTKALRSPHTPKQKGKVIHGKL